MRHERAPSHASASPRSRSLTVTARTLGQRWRLQAAIVAALVCASPAAAWAAEAGDAAAGVGVLPRLQALLGLVVMVAVAWFSRERRPGQVFPKRVVIGGLALQLVFGLLILKTDFGAPIFGGVNDAFVALM